MRKSKIVREQKRLRKQGISSVDEIIEKQMLDAYYHETVEAHKASKIANEMVDKTINELEQTGNIDPNNQEKDLTSNGSNPVNGDNNE